MPAPDYSATIEQFNSVLESYLPAADEEPQNLHQAMRYAVLGEGKRLRPLFTFATGEILGIAPQQLHASACAVELIHAYSLVHDDLPAMDDDKLRRGKPCTHIAFDEATAILAGDALQALAFDVLARQPSDAGEYAQEPAVRARTVATLAQASCAMVGGQALDMAAEGKSITPEALETIHRRKTGALLRASVLLAADTGGIIGDKRAALERFAGDIGLAFQVRDDILDVEASTLALGKTQGADQARGKATYPALLGLQQSKDYAESLYRRALQALDVFGAAARPLRELAGVVVSRDS